MTFPGWDAIGLIDDATYPDQRPREFLLPEIAVADYYDPTALGGVGTVLNSVSLTVGGDTCTVRASGGSVEARFTRPMVYAVVLLDSFDMLCGAPCSCLLTIYADDRVTTLWEVSTVRSHARPYLVQPGNYQTQEIDVASGSATVGSVSVVVIDAPTLPGDQDSGWLTAQLAFLGLANVAGRRARLVRFISSALGFQVVADGPAGAPRLDPSYAAYSFEIRDTRDTERKVRCFDEGSLYGLLPEGVPGGYGFDAGTSTFLLEPLAPLVGQFSAGISADIGTVNCLIAEASLQGNRRKMSEEAYDTVNDNLPHGTGQGAGSSGDLVPDPRGFIFRWRLYGTLDPWKEITLTLGIVLGPSGSKQPNPYVDTGDEYSIDTFTLSDSRLNPLHPDYDPTALPLPANGDKIEFFLLGMLPPSASHPVLLDGTAAGQLAGASVVNATNTPVLGRYTLIASLGGFDSGTVDLVSTPGNAVALRQLALATFNLVPNLSPLPDIFIPDDVLLRWRPAGSSGAWNDVPLAPAVSFGASVLFFLDAVAGIPIAGPYRVFLSAILTAATGLLPTDGEDIEFTVTRVNGGSGTSLTAGQFVVNMYSGLYSARDQATGAVVDTGIRFDTAAVLQITTPVRLRITEPIEDARDFAEKCIYAPTGWVPALDSLGLISPVSQVPPADLTLLTRITNAIAEPAPDWNAGERYVNVLRFSYTRDYATGPLDDPSGGLEERQRRLVDPGQDVLIEFRDEPSVARNGEQVLELDGQAFHAIGADDPSKPPPVNPTPVQLKSSGHFWMKAREKAAADAAARQVKQAPQQQRYIVPVSGDVRDETAYQLGLLREQYLLPRFSYGAPAFGVNVMRSAVPTLRAGDWVMADLSWLPDYITTRRGLVTLAHVVALGDLDCAWRHLLLEQVVPPPAQS